MELPIWPYVYGGPSGTGIIRSVPEDFIVTEQLAFQPSGDGEHVFLQIEKTGENTEFVARQLARFAHVRQRDVGYAGLKDRHAVATQWFSVWLPGSKGEKDKADPDWTQLASANLKILMALRHARKLKRGTLSGNRFKIRIRDWQGDQTQTLQQLQAVKAGGIANYYGMQRFGYNGQNINKALAMFQGMKTGREQRSLYLSAARSFLFNQLLACRVEQKSWNQPLTGDTYLFDLSNSCFKSQLPDEDIIRRLAAQEIHPSGVLWGKGDADVSGEALRLEQTVVGEYEELAQGLINSAVARDKRPLRVNVQDLRWQFINESSLELDFSLPAGSYATSVLREIIGIK